MPWVLEIAFDEGHVGATKSAGNLHAAELNGYRVEAVVAGLTNGLGWLSLVPHNLNKSKASKETEAKVK
jgi:hypothetical protein